MYVSKLIARLGVLTVAGAALLAAGSACSSDSESPSVNATCADTCAKSIALGCPGDTDDQAGCEASCEEQQAACVAAGQSSTFQSYLDCVETAPMVCGDTLGTASSADCLQQGLAALACALAGGDVGFDPGDLGGGGDASGGTFPGTAFIEGSGMFGGNAVTISCVEGDSSLQFYHQWLGLADSLSFRCRTADGYSLDLSISNPEIGPVPDSYNGYGFEVERSEGNLSVSDDNATRTGLQVQITVDAYSTSPRGVAGHFEATWTAAHSNFTGQYTPESGSLSGTFGGPLD